MLPCKGSTAEEKAAEEAPSGSAASAMAAALAAAGPQAAAPPIELLALPDGVPESLTVLCNSKQGHFNLRTQSVEFKVCRMESSELRPLEDHPPPAAAFPVSVSRP